MLRSGATSFYEADGLGSITSLSSGAGALAQTYTFDSFGKQTGSTGSLTNPFQYTAASLTRRLSRTTIPPETTTRTPAALGTGRSLEAPDRAAKAGATPFPRSF